MHLILGESGGESRAGLKEELQEFQGNHLLSVKTFEKSPA